MERSPVATFLSSLLQPSWQAIVFSVGVALILPILLHLLLYRQAARSSQPTFLLMGTSGAGKTSLLTLFETGTPSATRPSQLPSPVELSLPAGAQAFSARFRSANDPTLAGSKKFLLTDTPGHGKLRHHALRAAVGGNEGGSNVRGIIFVVDAANLPAASPELREAAEYLHDLLLVLQKKLGPAAAKGGHKPFPLLVAANKMDLFTALPEGMVRKALELEVSEVRQSRATGLMDSGAGDADAEKEWLGDGGETIFDFTQMEDSGIEVHVLGGVVAGQDGPNVDGWWQWIAEQM